MLLAIIVWSDELTVIVIYLLGVFSLHVRALTIIV